MPRFDYQCTNKGCGYVFEHIHTFEDVDKKLKTCPACLGQTLIRKFPLVGTVIFKGAGFHATDYARTDPAKDHNIIDQTLVVDGTDGDYTVGDNDE